jgi:hypothetical protein
MPSSTEARIEEICARIRVLCCEQLSPETEAELRELARELRAAIRLHLRMAKSSLHAKQSAIAHRDPARHDPEQS